MTALAVPFGGFLAVTDMLTLVTVSVTLGANQARPQGRRMVMPSGRGECGACGRGLISFAPGRSGHHACRHYDRRARCIAGRGQVRGGCNGRINCARSPLPGWGGRCGPDAPAGSPEAWPGLSLGDESPPGESRGGTPAGERARKRRAAQAALSLVRPVRRLRAGHETLRLPAFRFLLSCRKRVEKTVRSFVIASSSSLRAQRSNPVRPRRLDCFVASLLAMTGCLNVSSQ
jgi:hypothetical protein